MGVKNNIMAKIEDLYIRRFSGNKPEEEELLKVIKNRQEKQGLEVEDFIVENLYESGQGYREYIVIITFKKHEEQNRTRHSNGWMTEELSEEDQFGDELL